MTPFVSALLAASWLGFVTLLFTQRWLQRMARQVLVHAHAPSGRTR
jgi:hypothetical protein